MELQNDSNATDPNLCICSDITREDYSIVYTWFNLITVIILMPALSVVGVISNIVNIFLFSRPSLVSSANTYLMALASSDIFVVTTGLFIFWIDSARSYLSWLSHTPYFIIFTLPVGYMAQTCSVYFTVAAAIDCYVAQSWSAMFPNYNKTRRAKQIVAVVVVISVLYNSLRFGNLNLRSCMLEDQNTTIVEICPTALFFKINLVYNVYMYMIVMTFLPFLLLSILNTFIVTRIHAKQHPEEIPVRNADDTITMVMVVIMFLVCNVLSLVINIVETVAEPSPLLLNYMSDGSNFLIMFNSSINFLIYMLFSNDFYRMYWYHFRCPCKRGRRPSGKGIYTLSDHNDVAQYQMTSFSSPEEEGVLVIEEGSVQDDPGLAPIARIDIYDSYCCLNSFQNNKR